MEARRTQKGYPSWFKDSSADRMASGLRRRKQGNSQGLWTPGLV